MSRLDEGLVRLVEQGVLHPTGRVVDPDPSHACGNCAGGVDAHRRGGHCDTKIALYGERDTPRIDSAFWPGCEAWRPVGTARRRWDPYG